MHILVVTPYPPVLHVHGGGVRMFHNIRILAQRNSVHVLSFVENEEECRAVTPMEAFCKSVAIEKRIRDFVPHCFSLAPFMAWEFQTPMRTKIRNTLNYRNEFKKPFNRLNGPALLFIFHK